MRVFRLCLILSCIISLLSGCVTAVLLGATAGGLVVYDQRSLSMIQSDIQIAHRIRKKIANADHFERSRIKAVSFNGVVLLLGQASDIFVKQQADKMAQQVPDVKRVYNRINIAPILNYTQTSQDTWVTSQIRSLFLAQVGLKSGSIRIVTEDGVVYLMGFVTEEQGKIAATVARQVNGVRQVVKMFQYIRA